MPVDHLDGQSTLFLFFGVMKPVKASDQRVVGGVFNGTSLWNRLQRCNSTLLRVLFGLVVGGLKYCQQLLLIPLILDHHQTN